MTLPQKRYRDFNTYLRSRFGCRVQKITIDAGMSCPNRDGTLSKAGCIYCNDRGSGTGAHSSGLTVGEQIHQGKAILGRRYKAKKFLAYFQSFSNTYAPLQELRRIYDQALAAEDVVGLCIGTRPDCVSEPVLDLLQGYAQTHMVWVEYGLQSAHDDTLTLINRGHDFDCFVRAVRATQNRGIEICAHVILGLPGENSSQMDHTIRQVAALGIDGIKLHLLYVIRHTALEQIYRQGRYRCLSQQEYVRCVCDALEQLPPETVIQRLTGDPHPQELVAPRWALQKTETLAMIHQLLETRGTRQAWRYRRG